MPTCACAASVWRVKQVKVMRASLCKRFRVGNPKQLQKGFRRSQVAAKDCPEAGDFRGPLNAPASRAQFIFGLFGERRLAGVTIIDSSTDSNI